MIVCEGMKNMNENRANLGQTVPVMVYRMMLYAMMETLTHIHGTERAQLHLRKAGWTAGQRFAAELLNVELEFSEFLSSFQKTMRDMSIGILRFEYFDERLGRITWTVSEDLGCAGLRSGIEQLACHFDEGFYAGILEAYMCTKYEVQMVDCWVSENRVCRFCGMPKASNDTIDCEIGEAL